MSFSRKVNLKPTHSTVVKAQHHALGNRIRQAVISFPTSRKILVVPGSFSIFHFLQQLLGLLRDTSLVARSIMKKIRFVCSFTKDTLLNKDGQVSPKK